MIKKIKLLVILSVIQIVTTNSIALVRFETLKVLVLKIETDSIISINRGIEDGVRNGDHVQFKNDSGFISRGIAVKREMTHSYWKLYHTYNKKELKEQTLLELRNIPRKLIPDYMAQKVEQISIKRAPSQKESKSFIDTICDFLGFCST